MRQLDYTDEEGRTWRVELPDGAPDAEAPRGIIVGPPPVADGLALPEPFATRLHNELHRRKLWSLKEVQHRPHDVQAAILAAFRVDVIAVVNAYVTLERPEGAAESA